MTPTTEERSAEVASTTLPKDANSRESWGWTRRQRVGLGMLLTLLVAFLGVQYLRRPYRLEGGAVLLENQNVSLPQRVDPNIATPEQLARIPHIGEALALKIVQYRDVRKATAAGGVVFHQSDDLDAVPGIGKKLVEQLAPFLEFPDEAPATQP